MSIRTTLLSAIVVFTAVSSALAANELPMRAAPIPETTNGVPHVQIGVEPVPEISEALIDKVATIPGIDIRNTVISLPGALGFWIKEDVTVARPEVIVGGREFAHIHPDGSLHASLPPALAKQAVETGWAVSHPWANKRPGWEGFVMIFTPTNAEELDVVLDLVQASYQFVTGQE
ncbi:luciferase family protein [uncultured Ruegeria sp.]|uniref:luciferase domain-containing protein n=1 Tax=uncultured Ruegeria sp. TaxID=259304 RepID=UPI002604A9DA|nr:luciferase family protein [uncultured Ruegeria sp.]